MKRLQVALLSSFLLLVSVNDAQAAHKYSDCVLTASTHQIVSLGKPLATERLGHKSRIKVGILPFYFTDGSVKQLTNVQKSDYLQAASRIRELSNQNVDIEIVFFPSVDSGITSAELHQARILQGVGPNEKDSSKSTWGVVRRILINADKTTDLTNLDSVILVGSNEDGSYFIAEAMQFFRGNQGNIYEGANLDFFKSISTQDGFIDNAILLDNHKGPGTIVHELLHNFGLTDLYGRGSSSPGSLSLMAGGARTLLNYEKALLGWFTNENFKCSEYRDVVNESKVNNELLISNIKQDSILLLKVSSDTAYIIEIINDGKKSQLVLYLLEQEFRPPITVSYDPKNIYESLIDVSNAESVGLLYKTNDFYLLVSDARGSNIELNIIPKNLTNTKEADALFEKSRINRENLISLRSAAEKAAAEKAAEEKILADAKVEAARILVAAKAASAKKTTITCVKGKLTKKVTAVKPVCPAGYKKKL